MLTIDENLNLMEINFINSGANKWVTLSMILDEDYQPCYPKDFIVKAGFIKSIVNDILKKAVN